MTWTISISTALNAKSGSKYSIFTLALDNEISNIVESPYFGKKSDGEEDISDFDLPSNFLLSDFKSTPWITQEYEKSSSQIKPVLHYVAHKAGMDNVNKSEIEDKIHQISKNSLYYAKEKERTEKIDKNVLQKK